VGDAPDTGRGVAAQADIDTGEPTTLSLVASTLSGNLVAGLFVAGLFVAGLFVVGSPVELVDSLVVGTLPAPLTQRYGRGIHAQTVSGSDLGSQLSIHRSRIVDSTDVGVVVNGSSLTMLESEVTGTRAQPVDGTSGDGIVAIFGTGGLGAAFLDLDRSYIASNARAGVAVFGATLDATAVTLDCNTIDIVTQAVDGLESVLADGGDNSCGCGETSTVCKASSVMLTPPEAL
jgi:hypothetical protein